MISLHFVKAASLFCLDSDEEDYSEDQLSEDCSLNDAVSSIAVALDANKLHRAAVLLTGALEAFHGATVLR